MSDETGTKPDVKYWSAVTMMVVGALLIVGTFVWCYVWLWQWRSPTDRDISIAFIHYLIGVILFCVGGAMKDKATS